VKRTSLLDSAILLLGLSAHLAAHGATYFVSASVGNDANAGTSPDTAWQSLDKVNHARMSTGDRVYLRAGDEWDDESLTVSWSGTGLQHAVIGAYYSAADGVIGYGPASGNRRPIIDDHYRWHGETFTEATAPNAGLTVSGSYVDVENLEIKQAGWGVRVEGDAQTDVTLSNVFVNGAFQCGIQAQRVTNLTIQSSELFNAEAFKGLFHLPGTWCSTIGIQHSHGVTVQDNYVHESWGEGINVFYGSSNAIVRNNTLYANQSAGIYMGALNGADVHGNLIFGTADKKYWRTAKSVGAGIAMDNESYEFVGGSTTSGGQYTGHGSLCPLGAYGNYAGRRTLCPDALQNLTIYDNLVAGTSAGLAVWYADYPADYTGIRVFNNTFVDNEQQVYLGGQNAAQFEVRNNLFMSLTPGMVDVIGSNYGIAFDTNYWSQGKPTTVGSTPLASATDVLGGAVLVKMSGWRNVWSGDQIDARSFMPAARSSSLGRGSGEGLFFDTDFFGRELRDPVDLGGIADFVGMPQG
jgi:parallel beta-helix repeat protein